MTCDANGACIVFQAQLYISYLRLQGMHAFFSVLLQGIIEIIEKCASNSRTAAPGRVSE
jgi:hypothetical protein